MRVLRVIWGMDPENGGPAQGIRNLVPALERLGVHNEVLSLDDPSADYLVQAAFPIHAVGTGKGPWAYQKKLAEWLATNLSDYDAVILHGLWLYTGFAVRRAVEKLRRDAKNHPERAIKVPKYYVYPHGMLDPWFQKLSVRPAKAIRNWIYWKAIERKTINLADGVLFTCEEELRLARVPFRPYSPRELMVGYGVPESPAYRDEMRTAIKARCPELGDHSYLLFLSRIHPKKGVDLLLKAYAACLKDAKDPASFPALVVAGPLDSAYAAEMRQLAADLGLPRVYFPGMLQGDAKWGAFYGCDAFILPSHQENFGIAVVEALACGRPTLISSQVNIWREITAAKAGLAEPDTVEGTAALITAWLALPEEARAAMQAAARTCFLQNFEVESAASHLAETLRNDRRPATA